MPRLPSSPALARTLRSPLRALSQRQLLTGVAILVLTSRGLVYLLGVRFYDQELDRYMPFLDPALLRTDLFQSVWHLHLKPPLMNFGAGVVLQTAGDASTLVFSGIFVALGVLLSVSLADLLCQLDLPRELVLVLTVGYAVSPSVLLFENFLYHTYPAAALLAATAACFGRALASGRRRWWGACFVLGMLLCYMRSLYHLVWLVGLVGLALTLRSGQRVRILSTAALPTTAVTALYAKNLVLFGVFGASSWLGISLAKGTVDQLPAETRSAWIEQRRLTPAAQVDPFAGPDAYVPYVDQPSPTGIPALDQRRKRSGRPNYNHRIYPVAADAQLQNALTVMWHCPLVYCRTVLRNILHWLSPTTTWHPRDPEGSPFRGNRSVLGSYERAVNAVFYPLRLGDRIGIPLLIPIVLAGGVLWGLRNVRRGQDERGGLQLFLAGTGLYVIAVSCLIESGVELSRFRFTVNALFLALTASLAQEWISSLTSQTE